MNHNEIYETPVSKALSKATLLTSTRLLVLPYDLYVSKLASLPSSRHLSKGLLTGYIICLSDCLELDSPDNGRRHSTIELK